MKLKKTRINFPTPTPYQAKRVRQAGNQPQSKRLSTRTREREGRNAYSTCDSWQVSSPLFNQSSNSSTRCKLTTSSQHCMLNRRIIANVPYSSQIGPAKWFAFHRPSPSKASRSPDLSRALTSWPQRTIFSLLLTLHSSPHTHATPPITYNHSPVTLAPVLRLRNTANRVFHPNPIS